MGTTTRNMDEKLVAVDSCGSHGDDSPHSRGSAADNALYDDGRLDGRSFGRRWDRRRSCRRLSCRATVKERAQVTGQFVVGDGVSILRPGRPAVSLTRVFARDTNNLSVCCRSLPRISMTTHVDWYIP